MTSHLLYMSLFSLFVAIVFGTLLKDEVREQVRFAALAFAGFMGCALVLGWVMYPFPL